MNNKNKALLSSDTCLENAYDGTLEAFRFKLAENLQSNFSLNAEEDSVTVLKNKAKSHSVKGELILDCAQYRRYKLYTKESTHTVEVSPDGSTWFAADGLDLLAEKIKVTCADGILVLGD